MTHLVVARWDENNIVTAEAFAEDEARAIELRDIMVSEGNADAFYVLNPGGRSPFKVVDPVAKTVTFDQNGYDQNNAMGEWVASRRKDYGDLGDQLDMQYWDGVNDTTVWVDHVAAVKSANPKPT